MMKKFVKNTEIELFDKLMNALAYKKLNEKKIPFENLSLITYQSEKEDNETISLRHEYLPMSTPPFSLVILFIVLALALATSFLVLNIINKEIDKMMYFFILMLPAFIFMLLATFISFRRYFATLKNIERFAYIPTIEKKMNKNG